MWEDFFFAFFKVFQPSNGAFDLFFLFPAAREAGRRAFDFDL
ncbi:MAG: hypothetical protein WC159_12355 [Sphaerochaetaceae bacterium]